MSPVAQYAVAGLGLTLLVAICGSLSRIGHELGRIALAREKTMAMVERNVAFGSTGERCPDYPPPAS